MGAYGSPEHVPQNDQQEKRDYSPYGNTGYANPAVAVKQKSKLKWWQITLMVMGGLFAFIMIMGIIGANSNTEKPTGATTNAAAVNNSSETPQDYKASCGEYFYKDVARNPNNYIGKQAKFTGQVAQIQESGNSIILRANVTKGEYGLWDDAVYVEYTRKSDNESRILENDVITLYGELDGIKTYSAIFGNEVSIPLLKAEYIDILTDSSESGQTQEALPGAITKEKYDKLEPGMTYEQVKDLIGSDGDLLAEVGNTTDSNYSAIYSWSGNSTGASANITFIGNKLETKVQYGLD